MLPKRDDQARPLTIGMLSTYPPTLCGLATFSSALARALTRQSHHVDVVRVDDSGTLDLGPRVLRNGSAASVRRAAETLSGCDIAIIQHEYGIYGGADGDEVLEVMRAVSVPIVTVLHTVPQQASGHQTDILIELCKLSDLVVVMSESAQDRLVHTYYPVDERKVVTIPHGAELARHVLEGAATGVSRRPRFLTWGLIGPGKGIEHVIDAVGLLHQLGFSVRYTVAGSVHPKVLAREGTAYRDGLMDRARTLGVCHLVTFDDMYRGVSDLTEYIATFDVVVMAYDTQEQVTSGVLVDSLAAGRAVIATRFPHAVEMLGDGTGITVPHRDPRSLAVAMHTLFSEPEEIGRLQERARQVAPSLSWDAVASEYLSSMRRLVLRRAGTIA